MEVRTALLIFHIIGVALGLGGATVSDILFLRSIKDRKITSDEFGTLKVLSRIVWAGITILILSGIGFLITQYIVLDRIASLEAQRFIAKLTLVAIVFINGLVFHFKVFPIFKKYVNSSLSKMSRGELWLLSATGAISTTSWYSIIILSLWRTIPLGYWQILSIYLLILSGGILTARLLFQKLLK